MKEYICREPNGWQLGQTFIPAGGTVKLTDADYAEYSKVIKLELKDAGKKDS